MTLPHYKPEKRILPFIILLCNIQHSKLQPSFTESSLISLPYLLTTATPAPTPIISIYDMNNYTAVLLGETTPTPPESALLPNVAEPDDPRCPPPYIPDWANPSQSCMRLISSGSLSSPMNVQLSSESSIGSSAGLPSLLFMSDLAYSRSR